MPAAFGGSPDRVRVISPFVGGAFGQGWQGLAAPVAGRACGRDESPDHEIGVEPQADVQRSGLPSHQPTAPGRRRRQHRCNQRDGARGPGSRPLGTTFMRTMSPSRRRSYTAVPTCVRRFAWCPWISIRLPTCADPGVASGTFALECAMDELGASARHGSDRAAPAQRTRARPGPGSYRSRRAG